MEQYLAALTASRASLIRQVRDLTPEQLNQVPPGHSNNIIWNMGHMLAVSENILYKLSPQTRPVHGFDINQFDRSTRPEHLIGEAEIQQINIALMDTGQRYQADPPAMIGQERFQFLLLHESLHIQTIHQIILLITNL